MITATKLTLTTYSPHYIFRLLFQQNKLHFIYYNYSKKRMERMSYTQFQLYSSLQQSNKLIWKYSRLLLPWKTKSYQCSHYQTNLWTIGYKWLLKWNCLDGNLKQLTFKVQNRKLLMPMIFGWGENVCEVQVDEDVVSPSTASVLLVNILVCLSVGDMVWEEELDCEEVPETKVFSLSASEVIFFLVWLGVGGLDTEYTKSSLSSSCTEHESLLSE